LHGAVVVFVVFHKAVEIIVHELLVIEILVVHLDALGPKIARFDRDRQQKQRPRFLDDP
jgi:hypothetical protein